MHIVYINQCTLVHGDNENGISAGPNADIMHMVLMILIFPLVLLVVYCTNNA